MIGDIRVKFDTHNLPQCPDIGQNLDWGISDFRISGQFLIKVNCQNFRTSDDIDMKLGPVTKLDKSNKRTSEKLMMALCRQIAASLLFFQFMANLEQTGSRIPDAYSAKLTFSLTVTFYLTKTENRTKKFLTQLLHIVFIKEVSIFAKKADFL